MLLAIRIVRSWNQTGQKFAGEPDMVKIYLHPNPVLLWCLAGATYFWVHQNLIFGLSALPIWFRFTVATGLVLAAFTFKVAFTLEDAPELVTDFARQLLLLTFTQTADLVSRARAVFIGVGLGIGGVVAFMLAKQRISWVQSGMWPLVIIFYVPSHRPNNFQGHPPS
jgi:ethanolaminephosphotransferase